MNNYLQISETWKGKLLLTQALQSGSANRACRWQNWPVGTYVAVIRNETGEVKVNRYGEVPIAIGEQ